MTAAWSRGGDAAFEDETKRDALISTKMARIDRKLKRRLPKLDTVPVYARAGGFGKSATGLPAIGEVPVRRVAAL